MTRDDAINALATVIDPELGMNIVHLGLVYEVEVIDEEDVLVTMTLTTAGCPLHDAITGGAERALIGAGARKADINLVFEPPWDPDRIGTPVGAA